MIIYNTANSVNIYTREGRKKRPQAQGSIKKKAKAHFLALPDAGKKKRPIGTGPPAPNKRHYGW